jgi:elongation factor 3
VFSACPPSVREVIIGYIVTLCIGLGSCHILSPSTWKKSLMPHLENLLGSRAEKMVNTLRETGKVLSNKGEKEETLKDEFGVEAKATSEDVICDCTFTLACGAATLLSGAHLRLVRGCVYGLVGANDSGKSALLRAIHDRRVLGFPSASELLSALVEHGVGEKHPECDWTPLEYLLQDPLIKSLELSPARINATLKDLGFDTGNSKAAIKTLSGGWRMKLGLARAMLQAADVLLLDEPTGHLDTKHVDWLAGYLNGLKDNDTKLVTTVIVSHSAEFLDRVCTHVIHVQDLKLTAYPGNFTAFIDRVPDAQLGSLIGEGEEEKQVSVFVLPEPGPLANVRSRGKRFLHLDGVSYSYPRTRHPAVSNATVECSLQSRVALVGPNGAGKSTVAALLAGELAPDIGIAWRHPNLRMAFVAQHTFHHLDQHADLTATQYILWRFEGNEDREALEFRADEAEMSETRTYRLVDGALVPCAAEDEDVAVPEVIADRRQKGRLGYEYEVRWQGGRGSDSSTWVPRWQLAAMGFLGMATREDARQAAKESLMGRPLTTPAIEIHLAGFGLDAEEASHRRLGALSNGQRARVVLGAATWLAPHLLLLDEPSNYLDQPALSALASGLQNFGGGVVVISHNDALLEEVCTERWIMDKGSLHVEGKFMNPDEAEDANSAKVSSAASLAAKEAREKKKQKRLRELRRKNGEDVGEDDGDWWEELLKKTGGR